METSRCRCRPVADLDFGGPACFFLPHLAGDSAGSPPCGLYALVPPAILPVERVLAHVRHFLLHFRRSGRRLETGLRVYVDSIQKDPEVFLLDRCRVLDVGRGLAYSFDVYSLDGDIISFHGDFYAVKYLRRPGGLFASEVFDFKRSCFFVNLHGDWEVSVYGSEIVPVAHGYASDHVSDMSCSCSQHPNLTLSRPYDGDLDFLTSLCYAHRQVREIFLQRSPGTFDLHRLRVNFHCDAVGNLNRALKAFEARHVIHLVNVAQ